MHQRSQHKSLFRFHYYINTSHFQLVPVSGMLSGHLSSMLLNLNVREQGVAFWKIPTLIYHYQIVYTAVVLNIEEYYIGRTPTWRRCGNELLCIFCAGGANTLLSTSKVSSGAVIWPPPFVHWLSWLWYYYMIICMQLSLCACLAQRQAGPSPNISCIH